MSKTVQTMFVCTETDKVKSNVPREIYNNTNYFPGKHSGILVLQDVKVPGFNLIRD